jgi:hypothetical protein
MALTPNHKLADPNHKPIDPKLVRELAAFGVIALVAIVYFVFLSGGNAKKPTAASAPKLNTTFDTKVLDQVDKKDNSYPTINPSDVGRTDPFAP